jgi:redox-sensitive bicupin YhaK (pirin superfamily)
LLQESKQTADPFSFEASDLHQLEDIVVRAEGSEKKLTTEHALALHRGRQVSFQTSRSAHFLILSTAQIRQPVLANGPFIMNERSQIDAALTRYHAGKMSCLTPLWKG